MKLVKALIQRDKMTSIPKVVGAHEVPVLQSVHGDAAVRVEGVVGQAPAPDAAQEYGRLARVYGVDNDRHATHVELVYGRGPAQLAAALAADEAKEAKPAKAPAAPKAADEAKAADSKPAAKKEAA